MSRASWGWSHPAFSDLKAPAKMVAMRLVHLIDHERGTGLSVADLAWQCGMSERGFRLCLDRLEAAHLFVRRDMVGGGAYQVYEYGPALQARGRVA